VRAQPIVVSTGVLKYRRRPAAIAAHAPARALRRMAGRAQDVARGMARTLIGRGRSVASFT
jgi:hypothetical protein